jgi:predicted transcriptional regulator
MTTIEIPAALYRRLERVAALTHRALDELVQQALEAGVPPLPEDLSASQQASLQALESLSDETLWQIARAKVSAEAADRHAALLERNSEGTLSADERQMLDQLRQTVDSLMLRKAYAYVLLKWRGHRLPALADLEAQE